MIGWIIILLEMIFLGCEIYFYKKGKSELGLLFNILVVVCCMLWFLVH